MDTPYGCDVTPEERTREVKRWVRGEWGLQMGRYRVRAWRRSGPLAQNRQDAGATGGLAEIAPIVEFVGVFHPAVAYVGTVVHVGNENIFDAGIHLGLGLLHGLAGTDDDEHDS